MYIDGDNADIENVMRSADALVAALGYDGPVDEQIEKGSIFRRYLARAEKGLRSEELQARLMKAERALELFALDSKQAQFDQQEANAVAHLVTAFRGVPSACVRVGSILFVKYDNGAGPVVLARTLSQLEITTLEQFPELQRNPDKVLEALAMAISQTMGPDGVLP